MDPPFYKEPPIIVLRKDIPSFNPILQRYGSVKLGDNDKSLIFNLLLKIDKYLKNLEESRKTIKKYAKPVTVDDKTPIVIKNPLEQSIKASDEGIKKAREAIHTAPVHKITEKIKPDVKQKPIVKEEYKRRPVQGTKKIEQEVVEEEVEESKIEKKQEEEQVEQEEISEEEQLATTVRMVVQGATNKDIAEQFEKASETIPMIDSSLKIFMPNVYELIKQLEGIQGITHRQLIPLGKRIKQSGGIILNKELTKGDRYNKIVNTLSIFFVDLSDIINNYNMFITAYTVMINAILITIKIQLNENIKKIQLLENIQFYENIKKRPLATVKPLRLKPPYVIITDTVFKFVNTLIDHVTQIKTQFEHFMDELKKAEEELKKTEEKLKKKKEELKKTEEMARRYLEKN
jgi:hypothetical protein